VSRPSGLSEVYSGGLDEMLGELKVLILRGFTVQYVGPSFRELMFPISTETLGRVSINTIQVRAPKSKADHLVEVTKMTRSWALSFAYSDNGIPKAVTSNHETHDMYEALDMVFEWARKHM
jgi:hypothetical protein